MNPEGSGERTREAIEALGRFTWWLRDFEVQAERRHTCGEPDWGRGARLHRAVIRSIQRFQVGESGDGANLIAKADADQHADYAAAVRLFVAEEREHARMLGRLLAAAGTPTITAHWSDVVFVRLRRALGLRLELMVLMVAEVIALRYYRALRDGPEDALTTEVAGRILADEARHVSFHTVRLAAWLADLPRVARPVVAWSWWLLLLGAAVTVAVDHGPALRRLGVARRTFVSEVAAEFRSVVARVRILSRR
ncbi:ferritin-like domain-containing protein [Pseudonocardia acaciae]|uniref:ferritin-like domain-containing protein n=1 Tax=Pseudonocardia acaciae TaxID=551276 RepID=UPI0006873DB4|nr:ferritin-like domain-containing protein [Pseudonocardia acaciae]